ncbi:MAG: murein L,D-transpeptidase catalytic domain family protein [Bacteroidota bacterium]|nr:murein L,D-transpeptidase catalytic domain family protein [Bacteroidota bacterium]
MILNKPKISPIKLNTSNSIMIFTIKKIKYILLFIPLIFLSLNYSSAEHITKAVVDNSITSNQKAESIFFKLNIKDLDIVTFKAAYKGYLKLENKGKLKNKILSVIDFSKSSNKERMFVIDMQKQELKYQTLVSHGKYSGEEFADKFSNILNSNKSSIGFYLTAETYSGKHGHSLRLDGMEASNDAARNRAIVMHGADYATFDFIKKHGRLGRSQGCPALPPIISAKVINLIKEGSCLFIYYPSEEYLNNSLLLKA